MGNRTTKLGKPVGERENKKGDQQVHALYFAMGFIVLVQVIDIQKVMPKQETCDLPSTPGFSPHLGFVSLVWREIIAVETIAGVNLLTQHIK